MLGSFFKVPPNQIAYGVIHVIDNLAIAKAPVLLKPWNYCVGIDVARPQKLDCLFMGVGTRRSGFFVEVRQKVFQRRNFDWQ